MSEVCEESFVTLTRLHVLLYVHTSIDDFIIHGDSIPFASYT